MNNSFNLNTLKGRLAEQLIQDLFLNSNYNIFNYGLERLHQALSRSIKNNNLKTSKALRFMPDFVVQSLLTGDLFYMEVKFRANGCFAYTDDYKDYPYKNAWFVIVSPYKIQCIHFKRLVAGYKISPDSNYTFKSIRSFHITKELLSEYTEYAIKLFEPFSKKES